VIPQVRSIVRGAGAGIAGPYDVDGILVFSLHDLKPQKIKGSFIGIII
jgi:hypothetical protein